MQSEPQTRPRGGQKEVLDFPGRLRQLGSVVFALLFLAFYVYNQVTNTGFFTSEFGGLEMFAFYGSILLSLLPAIARAAIGRRNPIRPLEAFCNLFFAFASLFLLFVFPFNFAHFPDALPEAIRFLFWWLTNDVGKVLFVLAFVGGLISACVNIVRYLTF
jgi:hypothetical protein